MFTVTYDFYSGARARRRLRAARIALCLGTLACILLSQFAAFAQVCAGVRADTLRLHILANSDSEEDQALKLAVRDAILEEYGPCLHIRLRSRGQRRPLRRILRRLNKLPPACWPRPGARSRCTPMW